MDWAVEQRVYQREKESLVAFWENKAAGIFPWWSKLVEKLPSNHERFGMWPLASKQAPL